MICTHHSNTANLRTIKIWYLQKRNLCSHKINSLCTYCIKVKLNISEQFSLAIECQLRIRVLVINYVDEIT